MLAAQMLSLAGKGEMDTCRQMVQQALDSGAALEKFRQMCKAQGGDLAIFQKPEMLYEKAAVYELAAPQSGWVQGMDAEACGRASMLLGAGRETADSVIDSAAGIVLCRKTGDPVKEGETIARLYTNRPDRLEEAKKELLGSYRISDQKPDPVLLVHKIILGK